MANRNLTPDELVLANDLLADIRSRLASLSANDPALLFAFRRKIAKELQYDERGKPGLRRLLKARKMGEQSGKCARCSDVLPEKYAVLDRLNGMDGYTVVNTRLLCSKCDSEVQRERGYR